MKANSFSKVVNFETAKRILLSAVCTVVLLLFSTALQAQCAMCRASLESNVSDGNVSVSAKLNLGIIYLFVTPYLLFGLVAFFWYRASRKKAGKK